MTLRDGLCLLISTTLVGAVMPARADDDCVLRCPARPGIFGRPEPDKACVMKCLQGEDAAVLGGERPAPAKPSPTDFRFTAAWDTKDRLRQEREALERLLARIPDASFISWVRRHVAFDRVSRGPIDFRAGISPGVLQIYDPFWEASFTDAGRLNILTFELGKAVWFQAVNPGPREARPPRLIEFDRIFFTHQRTIEAMKFAALRGSTLADLTDLDLQSQFAYACRVALFNLDPPSSMPAGHTRQAWLEIQRDWKQARREVAQYLASVLRDDP